MYAACGAVPPAALDHAISARRTGPVCRPPERRITPLIGGSGSFFDWVGAGAYAPEIEHGAMHRTEPYVQCIHFGNDSESLFIRIDSRRHEPVEFVAQFHQLIVKEIPLGPAPARTRSVRFALPLAELGLAIEASVAFQIKVRRDGLERECHPENTPIQFTVLGADFALRHWIV